MKKLLLALSIVLCLPAMAQDALSSWTAQPLTIDGNPAEWPQFFRFYAPGTRFQFDVMNDKSNLYVCVRATEMESQARLMHSGLTFWFDPAGKKKQKEGLSFPVKLDHTADEISRGENTGRRQAGDGAPSLHKRVSGLKERVVFAQTAIKNINLPGITEPLLPLTNANGLNVAYGWDSIDILFVEYQIPLAVILGHAPTAAELQKPIGLGLDVGAIEAPTRSGGNGGGPSTSPTGAGNNRGMGGRPGGMTGQGQTMSGPSYDPAGAEQKTWLKLHLDVK